VLNRARYIRAAGLSGAVDALCCITHGFFQDMTLMQDLMHNLPDVVISEALLGVVYRLAPRQAVQAEAA